MQSQHSCWDQNREGDRARSEGYQSEVLEELQFIILDSAVEHMQLVQLLD